PAGPGRSPSGRPRSSGTDRHWGFAFGVQARHGPRPNRVRSPTDQPFASGCSPPRLAATQLPSATRSRPNLGRDFHPADSTRLQAHTRAGASRGGSDRVARRFAEVVRGGQWLPRNPLARQGALTRTAAEAQQRAEARGKEGANQVPSRSGRAQQANISRPPTTAGKWETGKRSHVPFRPRAANCRRMYRAARRSPDVPTRRG